MKVHRHKGLELVEKEHRCEVRQDKLFQFRYEGLDRFGNFGISHSCHLNEPFGYSIFRLITENYPYYKRIGVGIINIPLEITKKEFDEQVENISNLSQVERQVHLEGFRNHLAQYDNKQQWVDNYLEIYNN